MDAIIQYLSTSHNYKYPIVNVDYTEFHPCRDKPSLCDDICRCGEIRDVTISSINLNALLQEIYKSSDGQRFKMVDEE